MLDERSRRILNAVIQLYISDAGPVGSRAVTKKFPFGLSPATIRNIMSDLEDMGFLRQPHTSAGRVPTDIGYRYYVDSLSNEKTRYDIDLDSDLYKKLEILRKDVNSFLDNASKVLSELSHYIGITISPNANNATLGRIELLPFRKNQAAVVVFTDEGIIRNKIITLEKEISDRDLGRLAEYINSRFTGSNLDDIRGVICSEISRERAICDNLISDALRICNEVFSINEGDIFISGLSEVINLPDFCDIGKIRGLMKTLEDKHIILDLLGKIADTEGTQVFIGSENSLDEMKQFSLIAATYKEGNRPIGAIGIIGPTRMNYMQAISLVDTTARYITEILSYHK